MQNFILSEKNNRVKRYRLNTGCSLLRRILYHRNFERIFRYIAVMYSHLCFFVLVACAFAATPYDIREGLMSLYNSTGGLESPPLWIHNRLWGSDADYCQWEGVTCDGSGFIVTLDQDAAGLYGTLPAGIGLIGDMIGSLQMNRNTLYGSLPPEISQLSNLRQLDVQQNKLTGTVPSSYANLTKLEMFWVSYNRLSGSVGLELEPLLDRCAAYQPLGCRMQGNDWHCPTPPWVPVECSMLCVGH